MSEDIKNQIDLAVKEALETHLPTSVETKIVPAIESKIDSKVNGKIDALRRIVDTNNEVQVKSIDDQNKKLDSQGAKIDDLIRKTEGVIAIYNDSKGFWNVVKALASFIIPITVIVGAWVALKEYLSK